MTYTQERLEGNIRELKSRASDFTSKLNTAKLEVPNSESNGESFTRLETRITKITENTTTLETAGRERQEHMWRIPQELFDSTVLADLAQSTKLKGQLDQLFIDLESFKARARRHENINRTGMSSLEWLKLRFSSVCISKNVLQQMLTTLQCRFPGAILLLVGTGPVERGTGLRGGFTFER
jgi:transcriptional regulator with AAA-type ATPase domain